MPCTKKTYKKLMDVVRSKHPDYGLKRRKNIVSSMAYRRMKKK